MSNKVWRIDVGNRGNIPLTPKPMKAIDKYDDFGSRHLPFQALREIY